MSSSIHDDDSDSVSSSSSSEIGSSLSASQWNHRRLEKGVYPIKPNNSSVKVLPHLHLLKGRYYYPGEPAISVPRDGPKVFESKHTHSDLERAVLMDCLSNHFLLAHLPHVELEKLLNSFIKIKYRDHEIIYSIGDNSDYLYILYSGDVLRRPDVSEKGSKYLVLGELAVLTGTPYQETAQAIFNTTVFRVDKHALHRILRPVPEVDMDRRVSLLKQAMPSEMTSQIVESDLNKLASALEVYRFQEGEVLVEKKDALDHLVIIAEGTVTSSHRSLGEREYESQSYGPNSLMISFGWQSMLEGVERLHFRSTIVAQSDGVALMLSKAEFLRQLGLSHCGGMALDHLAARRLARIEMQSIPVFQDSLLDDSQIHSLLKLMHRCEYNAGEDEDGGTCTIFRSGEKLEPAIYFVREGSVRLMNKGNDCKIVIAGDYFGEQHMLRDQNRDTTNHIVIRSPMSAIANGKTVLDILYLEEIRSVIDTSTIGLGKFEDKQIDSVKLSDIDRHALLGTGSFGQVWLASINRDKIDSNRRIVAFKVQAKYQILESGKAERMIAERNILASLKSPFLLELYNSFQDESRIYMITSILQGGEIESLIPEEGMPESSAKFYAAGILEGLAYMHRRHLIHRDIKTANVLLNEKG